MRQFAPCRVMVAWLLSCEIHFLQPFLEFFIPDVTFFSVTALHFIRCQRDIWRPLPVVQPFVAKFHRAVPCGNAVRLMPERRLDGTAL